jgi:hypothetical protein
MHWPARPSRQKAAAAASRYARDENFVAGPHGLDPGTDLLDRADRLVPEDAAAGDLRCVAVEDVQVAAADGDGVDAHGRIGIVQNSGIW